jgi:thioredoxin 1
MENRTFLQLINDTQPVLVDFSAEWCGPCKMMAPILQEVKKALNERIRIIKVDVDSNPAAARDLNISGVPTLILFRNGKILWRQSGVVAAHQLKQVIEQHI